jgi:hypothetical protein
MTRDEIKRKLHLLAEFLDQLAALDSTNRAVILGARNDILGIQDALFADLPAMPESERKLARGTRQVVIDYCVGQQGLTADDGEWFYDKQLGCGWKINGKPIADWRAVVRAWKRQHIFPGQRNPQTGKAAEKSLGMSLAEAEVKRAQRRPL